MFSPAGGSSKPKGKVYDQIESKILASSIREIVKNSFVEELVHNLDILDKKIQEVESVSWDGGASFVSRNEKTERLGDKIDVSNSKEDMMEHFKEFFYEIKGGFF